MLHDALPYKAYFMRSHSHDLEHILLEVLVRRDHPICHYYQATNKVHKGLTITGSLYISDMV